MSEPSLEEQIDFMTRLAASDETWTCVLDSLRRLQKIDRQMMVYGTLYGRAKNGWFEPIDLTEIYKQP